MLLLLMPVRRDSRCPLITYKTVFSFILFNLLIYLTLHTFAYVQQDESAHSYSVMIITDVGWHVWKELKAEIYGVIPTLLTF